jgi:hypothetical protein
LAKANEKKALGCALHQPPSPLQPQAHTAPTGSALPLRPAARTGTLRHGFEIP